jgi:hypothetical protein
METNDICRRREGSIFYSVSSHFAESHLADSHLAESHLAESHFAESHDGWRLQTVLPLDFDSSILPIHIIATTSHFRPIVDR